MHYPAARNSIQKNRRPRAGYNTSRSHASSNSGLNCDSAVLKVSFTFLLYFLGLAGTFRRYSNSPDFIWFNFCAFYSLGRLLVLPAWLVRTTGQPLNIFLFPSSEGSCAINA